MRPPWRRRLRRRPTRLALGAALLVLAGAAVAYLVLTRLLFPLLQ